VLTAQVQKVVLVEEGTGAWCQWCPRGDIYGRELAENYPDEAVFVAVHGGDAMEDMEYYTGTALSSLPSARIDRASVSTLDPFNGIHSDMSSRLSMVAPASVGVSTNWDASSRNLTITITADFAVSLSGDYRLAAIVVEDGVTGPPPEYDQSNSYSGGANGPMGGYENLPSPVSGNRMVYNHVGRSVPGGYNGEAGSLPATINSGDQHSYMYTYVVPAEYNEEYIYAVGALVDMASGEILNAGKSIYALGNTNAKPFWHSEPRTVGYTGSQYKYQLITHDPQHDDLTLSAVTSLPPGLSLTDEGKGVGSLAGIPTALGTYQVTLNVSDGVHDVEQSFTIEIEEPKEDWEQVGQVGFNNMEVSNGSLDMADSGDVFAMTADYVSSTGMSVYGVYQLNNDSWELVGTEESSQGFSYSRVRMSVSPDGVPYVYDGASSVKKLENNAWIQVGSSLSNYDYCTLAFAPDGKLWFFGVLNGSGQALVLDNGTWVNQGMIHNDIMVFTTVKFDSNAYPVVLYATNFSPSLGYSQVSRWNGTSFDLVSGGYIHDSQVAWNHGLAITSTDEIYVGMSLIDDNDNMWLFKLENNSWNVIDSNITGGAIGECHLDTDDEDNVIIAYTDVLESEAVSVLKYDGTDFVYMGIPGFTGEGSSLEGLTMEGSNPWVLYKEATMGENPSVKKYVDLRPGDPSSTADNVVDRTIQVFPNPTTGVFTLKYEYAKSFEVIDLMGRMVQNGQIMESDNSQIEVNMSTSANGVYLLTVHGKNKTEVIQLVVQH